MRQRLTSIVLMLGLCLVTQGRASPLTIPFEVTNATLFNLSVTTPVPNFTGAVTLDLTGIRNSGVDTLGERYSTWDNTFVDPPSSDVVIRVATTSGYDSPLLALSGFLDQGLTHRSAFAGENFARSGNPADRISEAVLFAVSLDLSKGAFIFDFVGQDSRADIPGFDASTITDNLTFAQFLAAQQSLTFKITAYGLNATGGFTEYEQLSGTAHISSLVVPDPPPPPSPVPEPSTWLLLATGLVGLLGYGWRMHLKAPRRAKRHAWL
jgi:PEP-CTERM motif-containing protein